MNTANACCPDSAGHIHIHRSWRSVILSLVVGLIVTFATFWLSVAYSAFGPEISVSGMTFTLPVFLLVGIVAVIRPLLLMFDCQHEISCHHVRSTQGRCSLRKQFAEIAYEEILGVRASQNILERLFNVGSILIWTASAEHPDLILHGIKDPEYYARIIGSKIDRSIINERSGAKTTEGK